MPAELGVHRAGLPELDPLGEHPLRPPRIQCPLHQRPGMTNVEGAQPDELVRYVYGWGRTKHLPGPPPGWAVFSPGTQGVDWTLCGVSGGNRYERPKLPVCKHCLRLAAKAALNDGSGEAQ